ncbi:phosphonate C-P lyase system protein PhnG [uncultured Devosia sp.]|uniref:phosphonate C-P lyase system protein PhnG n=1 Tax=uncultured Devosia sp. TaxID=211434 RepID=UPI0035CA9B9C
MSAQTAADIEPRRLALNALAAADGEALASAWAAWSDKPAFKGVRGPETGLVMVRGRAGGGGAPFNLGEATVSRATVRLDTGEIGHGYCLGRDLDKARLIAVFDALFQREPAAIEARVLAPLRASATTADNKRRQETAATKVNFFTMVRGDN